MRDAGIQAILAEQGGAQAGLVGEDGHHRRHQRAAGAQGREAGAGDHRGLRRRAADRLSSRARTFRPQIVLPETLYDP
jgi:hypothetical protein